MLRLVRHRARSAVVGMVLLTPAAWIRLDPRVSTWWMEGLSLVLGATGVALVLAGISGQAPDWTDPDGPSRD